MTLVRATAALAVAATVALPGCGEDENAASPVKRFEPTIAQIHRVPPDFTREDVEVTGAAVPVKETGFVLRQGDDRIFVNAPPVVVRPLANGERVTVVGSVRVITPAMEKRLKKPRDFVRTQGDRPRPASAAARRALAQTPRDTGDPYVEADRVERGDG